MKLVRARSQVRTHEHQDSIFEGPASCFRWELRLEQFVNFLFSLGSKLQELRKLSRSERAMWRRQF